MAGGSEVIAESGGRYPLPTAGERRSNAEWESKTDADSRIAKMKDGTTHLAYKAEHVVDLKTDLVLAATRRTASWR